VGKIFNLNNVIEALEKKGAVNPCHRCGHRSFNVIEGFSKLPAIEQDLGVMDGMIIGGPFIPVVYIACSNCGAITPHAIGALGLLPEENVQNENKKEE